MIQNSFFKKNIKYIYKFLFFVMLCTQVFPVALAQNTTIDASTLTPRVSVSVSPRSGSFVEGSTFEVPLILNTKKLAANGVEVEVGFDKNIISVIKPSGGQSIVGVWVEPPSYDNTRGIVRYVGVIPNGIITDSGLIGTITFKALKPGKVTVTVRSNSNILLNDGFGTEAQVETGRAEYTIIPKAPEGVKIFSETHPFSSEWYNNNSPVLLWEKDSGVTGFSYVLDDKPNTVPPNEITSAETTIAYESLVDGLWYFHVKAYKNGVWGSTGHFLLRIDTTPPAEFTPEINYIVAALAIVERALVSFFTTDNLSGVVKYEVGVIDKSQPTTQSPVFVESQSPFQVPVTSKEGSRVIVRATDAAGNVRDSSVDVDMPFALTQFIKEYLVYILSGIILIALCMLLIHYLFGHHILRRLRRAFKIASEEDVHHSEHAVSENTNPVQKAEDQSNKVV
ncbi:MAG: hypothetical protein RJA61_663 [Candidatus Parcubacteria bacterium]|jgi:hypothetical protein